MRPLVCPVCQGYLCEPSCPNAPRTYQPVTEDDPLLVTAYHSTGLPTEEDNGVRYQRCGGGRRVLRKQIK